MICSFCGNETEWHELEDGRDRCLVCFATYDKPKQAKREESRAVEKREAGSEPKRW